MILQKLKYGTPGSLHLAESYFGIMSILNDLELAKREVELLAFTAVRGNIGSATSKKEFVEQYHSSLATVGNMVSKLTKRGLLLKDKKLVYVHKALMLEFSKDLRMEITFEHVTSE